MGRFIADQNKVVMLYESGTYAVPIDSGKWIGQVQEMSIDDAENKLVNRYLGNSSRSFGKIDDGPRDVTGTITYHPVDMNLIAHAIGSVQEASGTTVTHTATLVDSDAWQNAFVSGTGLDATTPYSFTLEDSKQVAGTGQNFIRTVKGCTLNNVTLNLTQGEKASVDVDWIGQNVSHSSGATTSVTAVTQRPYLWSDASLTVAGSSMDLAKEISLEINNNIEAPHYINGSRDIGAPYQGNREIMLNLTADLNSERAKMLYTEYYKGGSEFNAQLILNANSTGSQYSQITLSGCNIMTMDIPSPLEGTNEYSMEIQCGSVDLIDYTNPSYVGSYNPF